PQWGGPGRAPRHRSPPRPGGLPAGRGAAGRGRRARPGGRQPPAARDQPRGRRGRSKRAGHPPGPRGPPSPAGPLIPRPLAPVHLLAVGPLRPRALATLLTGDSPAVAFRRIVRTIFPDQEGAILEARQPGVDIETARVWAFTQRVQALFPVYDLEEY